MSSLKAPSGVLLRRSLVAAAGALVALPAGQAAAAQTTTLTYQCKYPLIGVKPLSVSIKLDVPDRWPAGTPTTPFGVVAEASAFDMAEGLGAVDDLTSIKGVSTAFATVLTEQGFRVPAKTVATIPETVLPNPVPNPLVLTATGQTPALTFDEPGVEQISLDRLAINLTALDSAGEPIVLPPVTKYLDADGVNVSVQDSDGDPNTFDVYCVLSPKTQSTKIGAFEIYGESTVTPLPTPSPTPDAGGPTPIPDLPAGTKTTNATVQCKWPMVGTLPADLKLEAYYRAPGLSGWSDNSAHSTPYVGFAASFTSRGHNSFHPREGTLEGALWLDVRTTEPDGTSYVSRKSLPIPRTRYDEGRDVIKLVTEKVEDYFGTYKGGTFALTIEDIGLNLTFRSLDGEVLVLPPVTKDIDGTPVTDSDGNPDTVDTYCTLDAPFQGANALSFSRIGQPTPPPVTPTPTPTLPPVTVKPTVTPTPPVTPTPSPSTVPTAKYGYTLQGSTTLNTLTKGSMPLTGGVNATLALATGDVTADLTLNDTQGRLTALGFIPVTATVGFVSSGPTTGKLVDDQLTTNSKVRIKVKSVKAFGAIPLAGGNNCQSKSLSDIALKSTGSFDPTGTGGTLAGTYKISDLNGCGPLNGLVSPITSGAGNTISVKLTPKA